MGLSASHLHNIIAGNNGVSGNTKTSGADSAGGTQEITSSGGSVAEKVKAQLDSMLSEVGAKKNAVSAEMSDLICQQQSIQWPTKKPDRSEYSSDEDYSKAKADYDQKKDDCGKQAKEFGEKIKTKNEEFTKLTNLENELKSAKSTAETLTDVDIVVLTTKVALINIDKEQNLIMEVEEQPVVLPEYVPSSDNSDKSPRQKELEYRLEELKTQYTGTQEALSNVEYRIEVISKQQNRLETSIGRLEVERDAVDAELSKLKDGYPTADKYFKEDGTFDNASFEADVSKYNEDAAKAIKLERDKEGIEKEIEQSQKEYDNITQGLEELHRQHEVIEKNLASIKTRYDRTLAELEELKNDEINTSESDSGVDAKNKQRQEEFENRIAEIDAKRKSIEEELEALKDRIDGLRQSGISRDARIIAIISRKMEHNEQVLLRLDAEKSALQAEWAAIQKIIEQTIENGFKTFNG